MFADNEDLKTLWMVACVGFFYTCYLHGNFGTYPHSTAKGFESNCVDGCDL